VQLVLSQSSSADRFCASAVLAVEKMAGWVAGWLSVTRRYCIKMDQAFFLGLVALQLWFLILHYGCEILMGRGACHSGGLLKFSVSDGNAVGRCGLPSANTLILPPHTAANKLPIHLLPPGGKTLLPSLLCPRP